MSNLILGIDPSKSKTGVCLWDAVSDSIYQSCVLHDMCPGRLSQWLQNYVDNSNPVLNGIVATYIETPIQFISSGAGGAATITALWHTLGIIDGELSYFSQVGTLLPPATWRKHLLGKNPVGGGWNKPAVLPELRRMFPDITREDELEACGIAKVGAMLWCEEIKSEKG